MLHGVHEPASRRYHTDSELIRKYRLPCEAVLLIMLKFNIVLIEVSQILTMYLYFELTVPVQVIQVIQIRMPSHSPMT